MSGFGGVVMAKHSCALVESRFEEFVGKFLLASFAGVLRNLPPHVGDKNNVLQCRFAAEFAEHVEIPTGDPTEPDVEDAVNVDDPSECRPFLVSVENFSPTNWKTTNANAHLPGCQEKCDHLQNICIASCSVTESWGFEEGHHSPVKGEFVRDSDLGCA